MELLKEKPNTDCMRLEKKIKKAKKKRQLQFYLFLWLKKKDSRYSVIKVRNTHNNSYILVC